MCKSKLGLCAVFCLTIIHVLDVCKAECDEYIIVFEKRTHPIFSLTPLKKEDIKWDKTTYLGNSTETPKKRKCIVELNYVNANITCQTRIKDENNQTSSITGDNNSAKPNVKIEKTVDEPKTITATTPQTVYNIDEEEFDTSMYDIHLIHINDNGIQNKRKLPPRCAYAETTCVDEGNPENYSLSDVKNPIEKLAKTLTISIDRDDTAAVQPIFITTDSKTGTYGLECTFKDKNCKQKYIKRINIYVYTKTNLIPNNTRTNYPNCTKASITSGKNLTLKCENVQFTKYNPHILSTPPPKKEFMNWVCHITEFNDSIIYKEKNSRLFFKNCLNTANALKTKYGDNTTPTSDSEKPEKSIEERGMKNDNLSQINAINILTILLTEKENNCSHNSSLDINEGKIIDLDVNSNKEEILQNNNIELILYNCINVNLSIINETQPHLGAELIIILKKESLNITNLKQFNGTIKEENLKQIILLRCDHPNGDSKSNTTSNKTLLQCESIDLHLYSITGIEVSANLNETINGNKTKERKNSDEHRLEDINNQTTVDSEVNNKSNVSTNNIHQAINQSTENNTVKLKNIEVPKNIYASNKQYKTQNFNRKKDIPNGTEENSLALDTASAGETEKIMLITILTIVGVSILMLIVLRIWPNKREYNPAPTREPPVDEETAF